MKKFLALTASTAILLPMVIAEPAFAQATSSTAPIPAPVQPQAQSPAASADIDSQEIIVTARRRSESDLKVPVAIVVLTGDTLAQRGINTVQEIGRITPSLIVADSVGPSGGSIAIRGIGAATTDPSAEQAALIVIDGASFANGNALRFGQFDIARVEVLKGPQSLFFGKNATAGLISITTANPTSQLYAFGRIGYNFNSRGLLTDGAISGLITSTLGARLAFFREQQDGYFKVPNNAGKPDTLFGGTILAPPDNRTVAQTVTGVRATLEFKPSSDLRILGKYSYGRRRGAGLASTGQFFACRAGSEPTGPGQFSGAQNCTLDGIANANGAGNASANTLLLYSLTGAPVTLPKIGNGNSYGSLDQHLGTLQTTYTIANGLNIDSLSSYMLQIQSDYGNNAQSPIAWLSIFAQQRKRTISQELRLTSDWSDSPFNFMIGGYYQNDRYGSAIPAIAPLALLNPAVPPSQVALILPTIDYRVRSETFAGFAQANLKITNQIGLMAGGRYTSEKRELSGKDYFLGADVPTGRPSRTFNSFSPEVTLSYTPIARTNIYISYRGGTKSGGFNTAPATATIAGDQSYDDEKVKGVEGGVKTVAANGQLRFDLAVFHYDYSGIQLGVQRGILVQTQNTGTAKADGVELSVNFVPSGLRGFNLGGSVNYNNTRFTGNAKSLCYAGQSVAQGCSLDDNGSGQFTNQTLAGQQLPRAPKWNASVNAGYEQSVAAGIVAGLSISGSYKGSFNPIADLYPLARQKSSLTIDTNLRVASEDERWELALIANNLTNKLRIQNGFSVTEFSNATTGTAAGGPPLDYYGFPNNPRSFMLRLSFRPFGKQ